MSHYWPLTVVSMKMYFRNKQGIFWALFFPFLIMIIFGLLVIGTAGLGRKLSKEGLTPILQRLGDDPVSLVFQQLLDEFDPRIGWLGHGDRRLSVGVDLPGLGEAFSARVLFYDDRYAGTWDHGDYGGMMYGTIEHGE